MLAMARHSSFETKIQGNLPDILVSTAFGEEKARDIMQHATMSYALQVSLELWTRSEPFPLLFRIAEESAGTRDDPIPAPRIPAVADTRLPRDCDYSAEWVW